MKRNLLEFRNRILSLDRNRCRNPNCPKKRKKQREWNLLSVHHIKYRSQGGIESSENGITFCFICDEYAHGRGNLKDDNGQRVTGDEFVYKILLSHKGKDHDRWEVAREHLKAKIEKKRLFK